MIMLMIFGTGIALILASLNVYFRDLNYLWQVVIQVYFFLVPIIYSPASMQERLANHPVILNILEWNPMAVYVRGFRHTLYDGEAPSPAKLLTMLAYAVAMFAIGQFVFNKLNRRIAEEL
jgi:ABC-type polysaccharide/polyol phosphate export permease